MEETKQLAYKAQGYLVKNLPAPFRSKGVIPGKYYDIEITNDITFDPDKLPLFINKVLALLGGTTNGK